MNDENEIMQTITRILKENNNTINESTLRETLLQTGYTPCQTTLALKQLKTDYGNIEVYPISTVIDYRIERITD